MTPSSPPIHVGLLPSRGPSTLLLLRKETEEGPYRWALRKATGYEEPTAVTGRDAGEAIHRACQVWRPLHVRMLKCGYRYTLPERDEVGTPALFHQMVASYATSTGIYFDEELQANCIVYLASQEARHIARQLL